MPAPLAGLNTCAYDCPTGVFKPESADGPRRARQGTRSSGKSADSG